MPSSTTLLKLKLVRALSKVSKILNSVCLGRREAKSPWKEGPEDDDTELMDQQRVLPKKQRRCGSLTLQLLRERPLPVR